jgi:DeoR/GlpR family transcriptional regulator of sugar metabolism
VTGEMHATWRVPQQRRRLIADYVGDREWVTIAELTEVFGISQATARRDLAGLARRQRVVRVHGGAGMPSGVPVAGARLRVAGGCGPGCDGGDCLA